MARTRRANARGTRRSSGIESGVTWVTRPSGVTIDSAGINAGSGLLTLAEINSLNSAAGEIVGNAAAGYLVGSGVSYWAGTTLSLSTGLTTISQIGCAIINDGVSTKGLSLKIANIAADRVDAAIYHSLGTPSAGGGVSLASTTVAPGCSIAFIAFGV